MEYISTEGGGGEDNQRKNYFQSFTLKAKEEGKQKVRNGLVIKTEQNKILADLLGEFCLSVNWRKECQILK